SSRRPEQPESICVNRLTIAVDDQISADFDFDSRFAQLEDGFATSHRVVQPAAIDHDRCSAHVARWIFGLRTKFACIDIDDGYTKRVPPTTLGFATQYGHRKTVGAQCVFAHRSGKSHLESG